jgi:hypothetical protein
MSAPPGALRLVAGLLGEVARDADQSRRMGFAWSAKPVSAMPGLPADAVVALLLASSPLGRESWQFLRGLDHCRPLSPRQTRALRRIAARHGLPVEGG